MSLPTWAYVGYRVPHITNAIQDWVQRVATVPVDESGAEPDVCVIELGESTDEPMLETSNSSIKVVPWVISRAPHLSMPSASCRGRRARATSFRFMCHTCL